MMVYFAPADLGDIFAVMRFHKIWVQQCWPTQAIRRHFTKWHNQLLRTGRFSVLTKIPLCDPPCIRASKFLRDGETPENGTPD